MITTQILGADKVIKTFTNLPKQVRFATAQALNDTAKDVQTFELSQVLPEALTLRSKGAPWQKPGSRFGVNIRPFANRDNLTATIGSQADWLKEQEKGGLKAIAGGHRAAIPTAFWKRREEIMQASKKPRAILKNLHADLQKAQIERVRDFRVTKKGNTVLKSQRARTADIRRVNAIQKQIAATGSLAHSPFTAKGKLHPGIYVRSTSARLPIKKLFSFDGSVNIKPVLHFEARGKAKAEQVYQKHFNTRLQIAILTAK